MIKFKTKFKSKILGWWKTYFRSWYDNLTNKGIIKNKPAKKQSNVEKSKPQNK